MSPHRTLPPALLIPVLVLAAAAPAAAAFVPEHISSSTVSADRYVDIDVAADGTPYVAYQADGIVVLNWKTGGAWHSASRAIASGNRYCALALDGDGVAHIALRAPGDAFDAFLLYERYDHGVWTSANPDFPNIAAGDTITGERPDITVDADGNPYISYRWLDDYAASEGDLRCAYMSGGSWVVETVDGGPDDVGTYSAIAIGASGRPVIAYYSESDGNLLSARKNASGAWIIETIDPELWTGKWPDIAVEDDGTIHVSYVDEGDDAVRHAYHTTSGWTVEPLPDGTPGVGEGTSIAVDDQGDVHIVYLNTGAGKLRHVVKSGGAWTSEGVDTEAGRGWRPQLALDASGAPHAAYVEEPSQDVWYATTDADVAVPERTLAFAGSLRVFPSPANAGAPVRIELEGADKDLAAGPAEIGIYDLAGRRVRTLRAEDAAATWDGRTDAGETAAGGAYVVRMVRGGRAVSGRVLLVP